MKTKNLKTVAVLLACILLTAAGFTACTSESMSTTGTESVSTSDMFTKRDLDASFDESKATKVNLSDANTNISGEGAEFTSEDGKNTVTISKEGTYIIEGSLDNGQIVIDADKADKIQIVLNGVNISSQNSAAIQVNTADKVFLTLASNSKNTLNESGDFAEDDKANVDGVIFSKEDLSINGSGELKVSTESGNGIVSKDDLVIASGTLDISASGHGIEGKDSVRIADGNISITSSDDGIHSENEDDSKLGFVYIKSGNLKIAAADDGIHSGSNVTIDGGNIGITKSSEGIEGQSIDINGGQINITSSDDGLNAANSLTAADATENQNGDTDGVSNATKAGDATDSGNSGDRPRTPGAGEDPGQGQESMPGGNPGGDMSVDENAYIKITSGELYISAEGDGIDSNGSLEITGGTVYIEGPSRGGNGALDFTGNGAISGGLLIATDNGSMVQSLTATANMESVVQNVSSASISEIVVKDSSGKTLGSLKPSKSYNTVIISGAGINDSTISYN